MLGYRSMPPARTVFGAARGAAILPLLMLALALGACDGVESDAAASEAVAPLEPTASVTPTAASAVGFPLSIVGSDGQELLLREPATRIVSYSPGATETLFAIGAGDRVIAADEFSDYPPETARLERVSYAAPDPERLLSLDPDLVILATRQREQVEQLRRLGLPVLLAAEPESVDGVYGAIELLGRATGHESEAADVVAEMSGRIDAVAVRVPGSAEGPVVFYELSEDLYTAAPATFIGGMLELLGARNVAAGAVSPFPQLTSEAVIASDPEVILLADAEFGASAESVASRPGWSGITAVIDGRVHPVDPDLGNRPGPRIALAIEEMARLLYPDRFPE